MIDFSLLKKNHKLIINEKLLEIQLSGKEILFHDWEKGEGACSHHHNELDLLFNKQDYKTVFIHEEGLFIIMNYIY